MTNWPSNTLVSTDWLSDHLSDPDIRIIDASWYLPDANRDPKAEYLSCHIPNAVYLDIDEISDSESHLPHMLPSPEKFSACVRKLGIGDSSNIIVYDSAGLFSAARVWWMFKVMGHERVAVLDGGLPKWQKEGRPTDNNITSLNEGHFTPRPNLSLIRQWADVQKSLNTTDPQIIDARSPSRFAGQETEPRPGVKAGHIPTSCNIHYQTLLDTNGCMLEPAALKKKFETVGLDISKPITTTCGSGVTAAILFLALNLIGATNISLYDGSWAEWGSRHDLPLETGTISS